MAHGDRRKCMCCKKLFRPDPRNRRHQSYCSAPTCKAASKTASQARWLAKPENQDYFRGPVNAARVKAWRSRHPGYWREDRRSGSALQENSMAQPADLRSKPAKPRTRRYKMFTQPLSDWLNPHISSTSSAPPAGCYAWGRTFSAHPPRGRPRPRRTAEAAVIDYPKNGS